MDNKNSNIEKLNEIIKNLENKEFKLYFFTLDTMGNPVASVANIYEHVKVLNNLGYKAYILHEKNNYLKYSTEENNGIDYWLGEEYSKLPHASIESKELTVGAEDFLIIPEVFSSMMQQKEVINLPCKKIVFSQSQEYIFELLPLGRRWTDFGFNDVITTSQNQADYLKSLFPNIKTYISSVSIPEYFKPSDKPKKPVVAIHCRNQMDTTKIFKSFYLKYPMFKWLSFKELRGLPRKTFAKELSESCLAVWVDDISSFGTFPIEAMKCNTPVIGKIPNTIPEWMVEKDGDNLKIKENGIWLDNTNAIVDYINDYLSVWLEDNEPKHILENMESMKDKYTEEQQIETIEKVFGGLTKERVEYFKTMITNLKED